MSQLTLELPEDIAAGIKDQQIPEEEVYDIVLRALRTWLNARSDNSEAQVNEDSGSRFAHSAIPYVDKLVEENRFLFERLAKFPDDSE
jgi:hypothetical protein